MRRRRGGAEIEESANDGFGSRRYPSSSKREGEETIILNEICGLGAAHLYSTRHTTMQLRLKLMTMY
jgi:hypothetical protein